MLERGNTIDVTREWHALEAEEILKLLGSNSIHGLQRGEVTLRLAQYGENALPQKRRRSLFVMFLRQFASPLIYILFLAAAIAFAVGKTGDAGVILIVVVINSVIGMIQEGRAERSMESLRNLSTLQVRVLRDGEEQLVSAHQLVPGDVMMLAAGDAVAADARLLESAALEASEAALTGESLPVTLSTKSLPYHTSLADRNNIVYSGTHILAGRGKAVVVATGLDTEVGKIAELTASAVEPKTPLEQRIIQFGRYLVGAAIALFVIVIIAGIWRGLPFVEILMVAISQMVSMVPEGLPVAMTIALAVGMQRMAGRNAIVRRLSAVETLGSTSVICSDKTGTLTRNEMTVTAICLPDGRKLEVTGAGYSPEGKIFEKNHEITTREDSVLKNLLETAALCNDAQLIPSDKLCPQWRPLGDPTEAALLTLALKGCIELDLLRQQWPKRAEIPFDSSMKMMATQHGHESSGRLCFKGAPEILLELCDPQTFNFVRVQQAISDFAVQTLRVLAVAELYDSAIDEASGFSPFRGRLNFLGLIGEMDPPRNEVKAAVQECENAGIRPVMVTGDHKATGLAVARMLGIARDGDLAIDGRELEEMTEQDLRHQLNRIAVFARVHPAQKLRIVEAFQSQQKVVAMTGDGVNDAPALAKADVGVAMGVTGTEVAKGAAKIVIADDNFSTIVKAVEEGRIVYRNLKKVLLFLFTTSIDEIIIIFLALFLGYPLPLAAVQILWINLVAEGLLTAPLVMGEAEGDEMKRSPISRDEPLITSSMLTRMVSMVTAAVVATFGFYVWRLSTGVPFPLVRSETLTVLIVCQWFNVLNCHSELKSVFSIGLSKNYWLLGGLALGNLFHFLVIYTEPMNRILHTVPIPITDFFLIGAVASFVLWIEEIRKWFARYFIRQHEAQSSLNKLFNHAAS